MTRFRAYAGRLLLMFAAVCVVTAVSGLMGPSPAHASSRSVREQGALLFHERGCEYCHGVDGAGTERAPSLSGVGRRLHKAQIERQIREGGKEMPAFGNALTDDEVQQLVAYLSAKKSKVAEISRVRSN